MSPSENQDDSSRQIRTARSTASFVAASNRLPVVMDDDGALSPSPGGLASALSSVMQRPDAAWVGWAGPGYARRGRPRRIESLPYGEARLHPIELGAGDIDRYYSGFCNSILWPLFHGRVRREEMNRSWWRTYRNVNERFGVMISRVAGRGATVWVHDYHLLLLPELLRSRRPDLRIGSFLHIPFPNPELFALLPWREQVLEGMLGADLLGFQVANDAANFSATIERLLDRSTHNGRLRVGRRTVEIDAFPISVDAAHWEHLGRSNARRAVELRHSLGGDTVFLGIDRLDYTKGITQRLQAFGELLDDGRLDPSRCTFVQVAVPSRGDVAAYQDERADVEAWIDRINAAHERPDGTGPILLIEQSLDDDQLAAWYRAADVLVVTSLADGMNLVAKEFVAANSGGDGAVVLSEFAGAAHDLTEAIIVNPYDIDGVKRALLDAVEQPGDEKRRRMAAMHAELCDHDVHRWATDYLDRLAGQPPVRERSMWNSLVTLHEPFGQRLARRG